MDKFTKADSLTECLVVLTKLNNRPATIEALSYGLPFDPKDSKQRLFSLKSAKANFSRAAANAGFNSSIVKRNLIDIPSVVLPSILVLKDDKACVLTAIDIDKETVEIIVPEIGDKPMSISFNKLEENYLGYAFFLKKNYQGERIDTSATQAEDKNNWFFGTLKKLKTIYGNTILATLLINLFVIAGPMFTMNVYDRVIPHNAVDTLWVLAIGICLIYTFDLFFKYIRTYFLEIAAKKSDIILSSILFEQSMNLKMKDKPKSVGSFSNHLKSFDSIRSFFASGAITAFIDLPFSIIFLLVIYSIHNLLVVIPLIVTLIILLYSFLMRNSLHKVIASTQESAAVRNGILIESVSNIETIKAFNANSSVQWKWEESTGDIAEKSLKSRIVSNSLSTIVAFLSQLSSVAIIITGVYLIKQGQLTMGGLIAVNILSGRTIAPMAQVASLLSNLEQTRASLKILDELMEKDVERPKNKLFLRRPTFKGNIEFKGVSFSYPEEANLALSNISFKINANEKVGIIGQVGSGKSTIGKLLLGFYDPSEGGVFIDGIDIKQIDPADLRHNFCYVPQDVVLLSGTVRDNITFKAPHSDDESIIKASNLGCVNNFTDKHPMGLDLQVGERGANLSGGQRQSVAIARSFISKSPIALLDEPTNSIDFTTETLIINNLKEATKRQTAIVITHKPTILSVVDRIIVIDNGAILMDGPKTEILAKLQGKAQ
ncbi:MAG: type I secretion system permease/ATPase [Desulfobacteraceae bacterium]|nr:type I secretion system permease/ATPase [Desulfobacteraceae bacterium]